MTTPAAITADEMEAVLRHVDARELVELASELIRIPSFKTEETAVALFLRDLFAPRGYAVDVQEIEPGRLQTIATLGGTGGGASLMLNGHTDINALTRRWRRDPWTPSLEGDRLYGHGVQNMKGGLASIIMAAEAVRRSGVRLPGDLVVACVAGETQGGEGTHYLVEQRAPHRCRGGGGAVRRRPPGDRALRHRALRDPHLRGHRAHRAPRGHGQRGADDDRGDRRARPRRSSATPRGPTCPRSRG